MSKINLILIPTIIALIVSCSSEPRSKVTETSQKDDSTVLKQKNKSNKYSETTFKRNVLDTNITVEPTKMQPTGDNKTPIASPLEIDPLPAPIEVVPTQIEVVDTYDFHKYEKLNSIKV